MAVPVLHSGSVALLEGPDRQWLHHKESGQLVMVGCGHTLHFSQQGWAYLSQGGAVRWAKEWLTQKCWRAESGNVYVEYPDSAVVWQRDILKRCATGTYLSKYFHTSFELAISQSFKFWAIRFVQEWQCKQHGVEQIEAWRAALAATGIVPGPSKVKKTKLPRKLVLESLRDCLPRHAGCYAVRAQDGRLRAYYPVPANPRCSMSVSVDKHGEHHAAKLLLQWCWNQCPAECPYSDLYS